MVSVPETLPASLDPSGYTTVSDYIDALTATARAQRKDRFFTYLTSIKEEDAYYSSGDSAGFGFRLTTDASQSKLMIAESFESGAALAAGIDRGSEIRGIGTTTANIQSISDIVRADPNNGLTNALGPDTAGTVRYFQVADPAGNVRTVSLTKGPIPSSRYRPITARRSSPITASAMAISTCAPSSVPPTRSCAPPSRPSSSRASRRSSSIFAIMAAAASASPICSTICWAATARRPT